MQGALSVQPSSLCLSVCLSPGASPPTLIPKPHAGPSSCQPTACTSTSQSTAVSLTASPPKAVLSAPSLVVQAWAARAGPGSLSLPPQDPTSRPPPASCPPAPRGLSSLFLRAALPPAAGSRRHCLEPPVRRRGQGGLGGRGPPRHWSSPLRLPAASRSDLSLMPPTRLGLGAVFVISKLGGQKIPGGAT